MKIAEVKISGFKSFVDGVHLPIESGLTGIVGPNGCGKSNVLESIRWVMGATSAKALRGSEMDDIIFAGTDTRPSRDLAEVIIRIDNNDGSAPEPYRNAPFIEISRKIRRGIGSTFRINGKEVRAKDVQLLFADASSGANSPAFVRQGQVSELINARPENRRRVLEEAAGIAGLQARRHEAQIKLNATEMNLERVGELLILMDEQISALKKQSVRARKYRELQGQIRGLELYLASLRLDSMRTSKTKTQEDARNAQKMAADALNIVNSKSKSFDELQTKQKPLLEEQAIADALLRRFEARRIEFERDIQETQNRIDSLNNDKNRINRDIARENELSEDAKDAIAKAQSEIAELETKAQNFQNTDEFARRINSLKSELSDLEAELSALVNQKAEINAKIREYEREKTASLTKRMTLANDVQILEVEVYKFMIEISKDTSWDKAREKFESLQDDFEKHQTEIAENATRLIDYQREFEIAETEKQNAERDFKTLSYELSAIESFLKGAQSEAIESLIGQIKVESGYERALSASFGDDLNAKIGESGDKYWDKITDTNFLWPKELEKYPKLSQFVTAPIQLMARINSIIVVENGEKISLPKGARAVTKDGMLMLWDGLVNKNQNPSQNAIIFEHINRKSQITPLIAEKKLEVEKRTEIFRHSQTSFTDARNYEIDLNRKSRDFLAQIEIARKSLSNAETAKADKMAELKAKQLSLINLTAQLKEAVETAPKPLELGQSDIEKIDSECTSKNNEIAQLRSQLMELQTSLSQINSETENTKKRLANANNEKTAWATRLETAKVRLAQLHSEIIENENQLQSIKKRPQELEAEKIAALGELPKIEIRKKNADDAMALNSSQIKTIESEIKSAELQLNAAREAINAAQIISASWDERINEIETQIIQEHQIAITEISNKIRSELGDILNNLNQEKAAARLAKAFSERDEIGGVNLRADEELKELSEKYTNLSNDRDELLKAIAKLKKAIDEINDEGKEKLLAAFDKVNQYFSELFTALFGGGNAHLALSETDDPLGGGLEVYACPPGKRLTSMSLMSGGEQALTATALIFAVFLSNPAPLSILDELDAPLDDANVDRFCALMDEMRKRTDTRFIVITHHPITMARMDRLFGVTMAERGVSNVVAVDLSRAQSMIEAA